MNCQISPSVFAGVSIVLILGSAIYLVRYFVKKKPQ